MDNKDLRVPNFSVDAESFKKPFTLSDEDKFHEMLACLPPENWQSLGKQGSYFQMSEYVIGDITEYYIYFAEKYYTFTDTAWMTPLQVLDLISEYSLSCGDGLIFSEGVSRIILPGANG